METQRLTIVQINDTHGYLEPHPELIWNGANATYPTMGGYARIAALLKAIRAENPDGVLALDNGDTFHGTYTTAISRGETLVPLVNALDLDAMTAHWEFAWGPAHLCSLAAGLDHPVLAINCYEKQSGARPFPASIVVDRPKLRIGVIGIAATIVDKSMPPHFSEGLRFTLGVDELPAEIARLRTDEDVDLIVVLSHLGFPQDVKLAQLVPGIDVILSGHTHNRLETPAKIGETLIIQSGCHGSFIGRLDLDVDDHGISAVQHRLVPVDDSIQPDVAMSRMVEEVMRPHRALLCEQVGETEIGLHRNMNLHSPMDDVLLAAISSAAETQIAFSNGWRYGAPIPPGPVFMNDLWNIIPTNPPVSRVDLTGAEIRALLEENLERTFSTDPFDQMGGYLKRFRGLTVYGKLENPARHRVGKIFHCDGRLDREQSYRVAFVTAQGVPLKYGRNREDLSIRAIDALRHLFFRRAGAPDDLVGRFIVE